MTSDNDKVMNIWMTIYVGKYGDYPVNENNKIPLSASEFIQWLSETQDNKFVFYSEDASISIYKWEKVLYIEANPYEDIDFGEPARLSHKFKIDDNIITKLKTYNLIWESDGVSMQENVGNILEQLCDSNLKDEYLSEASEYTLFEKRKKLFMKKIKDIVTVLNLDFPVKQSYVDVSLPTQIQHNGQNFTLGIDVVYDNIDNHQRIVNFQNMKKQIKQYLEPYIDMGIYVINVLKVTVVNLEFKFKTHELAISIEISAEIISMTDYYETIGYYKTVYDNVCVKKQFRMDDMKRLAKSLRLKVSEKDDICKVIEKRIRRLKWADFDDK